MTTLATEPVVEENDKATNFAELRKKANRFAAENEGLKAELNKLSSDFSAIKEELNKTKRDLPSNELLNKAGVAVDSLLEGKDAVALLDAYGDRLSEKFSSIVDQKLNSYKEQHLHTYLQAETAGNYAKVVNETSVKQLLEEDPSLQTAVTALSQDKAAQMAFLYQQIQKKHQLEEHKKITQEKINRLQSGNKFSNHTITMPTSGGESFSFSGKLDDPEINRLMDLEKSGAISHEEASKVINDFIKQRRKRI